MRDSEEFSGGFWKRACSGGYRRLQKEMMIRDAQPGDIIFALGKGLIEAVTFSNVRHVAIVYDKYTVFETDIWKRRAGFTSLMNYYDKDAELWRADDVYETKVQELCNKYDKTPYSYLDILTNLLTAPLHPKIRRKITAFIGNKYFMVCSELSGKILYEATKNPFLRDYESLQPIDLYRIFLHHPDLFKKIA